MLTPRNNKSAMTETSAHSIIVFHGDHGSRIGRPGSVTEPVSPDQYRADYSTLFAIKFPNGKFEEDQRVLLTSVLLEAFTRFVSNSSRNPEAIAPFLQNLSADKVLPYVFRSGSVPMRRVDINIFEDYSGR